jgi:hypothetical protein
MASYRVCRVEPFDPRDAIVDELITVTRRGRDDGGRQWIDRRFDERDAAAASVGGNRDELMVGSLLQQASRTCEGAAHRRQAAPAVALVADEVAIGPERMPAAQRHERARSWVIRPSDDSCVMVAPPAVCTLPAGVAAVQLRAAWASCAVRRTITHRTEPKLDDVLRQVGDRSVLLVCAHAHSVNERCNGPLSPAAKSPGMLAALPIPTRMAVVAGRGFVRTSGTEGVAISNTS